MLQSTSIVVYLIRSSDCLVMLKYVPSIKFAPVNYFLTIENTVTYLVLCFDDVIMTYKGCCVTKDSFHNFGSSSQIRSLEYSSPPPPPPPWRFCAEEIALTDPSQVKYMTIQSWTIFQRLFCGYICVRFRPSISRPLCFWHCLQKEASFHFIAYHIFTLRGSI